MSTPQPLPPPAAYRNSAIDTSDRLPTGTESRPIFTYAHFWAGWQYVELDSAGAPRDASLHGDGKGIGEWLPTLIKAATVKGSGGASHSRDVAATTRRITEKGGTVFLPGDRRLGRWADYLRVYLDVNGGQHFAELHERAIRLPNGGVRFESADRDDYLAMLRHIRDNAVDPMSEQAWDALRGRQMAEIDRLRELSVSSGRGVSQLERAERIMAAWEAAWQRERVRGLAAQPEGAAMVAEAALPQDIDYTAAEQVARQARPRKGA